MLNILLSIIFCLISLEAESKTMKKITKVVIPAAGLGTRFLPYTKSIPKEMLPILEKPSLQIIVEEGIGSGITEFNIIANDDKPELQNHFSHSTKLETELEKKVNWNF